MVRSNKKIEASQDMLLKKRILRNLKSKFHQPRHPATSKQYFSKIIEEQKLVVSQLSQKNIQMNMKYSEIKKRLINDQGSYVTLLNENSQLVDQVLSLRNQLKVAQHNSSMSFQVIDALKQLMFNQN